MICLPVLLFITIYGNTLNTSVHVGAGDKKTHTWLFSFLYHVDTIKSVQKTQLHCRSWHRSWLVLVVRKAISCIYSNQSFIDIPRLNPTPADKEGYHQFYKFRLYFLCWRFNHKSSLCDKNYWHELDKSIREQLGLFTNSAVYFHLSYLIKRHFSFKLGVVIGLALANKIWVAAAGAPSDRSLLRICEWPTMFPCVWWISDGDAVDDRGFMSLGYHVRKM